MNTHIRKIHKDINKLSQEIVKISAKKANRLKKNEEEKKQMKKDSLLSYFTTTVDGENPGFDNLPWHTTT